VKVSAATIRYKRAFEQPRRRQIIPGVQ